MIPQFPHFKSIELSDRASVEAHTSLYEPYSDFNFTCLWAWDVDEKRMISELNGNLVVKFTDYVTQEPFLSFLGTNKREDTARALIEYCRAEGLPTTLRLMPDVSISDLNPKVFTIEESRGDFDYIFSLKEIALLAGNRFQRKREGANKFWRENSSAKLDRIDCSDRKIQQQIIETIRIWEKHKVAQQKNYEIKHELEGTRRLFESNRLDLLHAVGLFSGETMIGYAIGEGLANNNALAHFLRSTNSYKGVTEALMQGYAKYLDSLQYKYLNFESDLDVDGMRRAKMSWRPTKFLQRYNVQYPQDLPRGDIVSTPLPQI